jgi:6-phosphogluconate dehydrogenase
MQAYAEGFNILHKASSEISSEDYPFDFDLAEIAEVWRRGSVIPSWLLDLTANALAQSPSLGEYIGKIGDSGEGRWAAQTALELGCPAEILSVALQVRFRSQTNQIFSDKLISALRNAFGGHLEQE